MKALIALSLAFVAPASQPVVPEDSSMALRERDGTLRAAAAPGLSPATQFQAGSIAKWVCTVAVMREVDAGRLSLDDRLGTLLPAFGGPQNVRLVDLLANRAGLNDGLSAAMREEGRDAILARNESAIEAANAYGSAKPISAPGKAYSYDLVNWMLVQAILERDGKPLGESLAETLFGPEAANLPDTYILTGEQRLDHASPIVGQTGPLPRWASCAGGLVTTPSDLIRFIHWAVSEGLSAPSLAAMKRVRTYEENYALGGQIYEESATGEKLFWLSGSNGAFKSRAVYRPSTGEGIAAMNSVGDFDRLEVAIDAWMGAAAE